MMQKINSGCSNQVNKPVKIIDENYMISNKLIPGLDPWKIKFILKQYGQKINERILNGENYSIQFKDSEKKITIRAKRNKSFLNPKLVLVVEGTQGGLNQKKVNIEVLKEIEANLNIYPIKEIYKFPKI